MRNLVGRIAIVTGGSSGIGRAICKALVGEGCKVVNISRRREDKGGSIPIDSIPGITTEICDVKNIRRLQRIILSSKPDILVNNVGILPLTDFLEQEESDYYEIMDTNLKAAIFATQAFLIVNRGNGSIVNISSTSGLKADPDTPIYGASKAALVSFTESIAGQYGDRVTCNCICPGFTDTLLVQEGPGIPQSEINKVPMGRVGKPEEVAEVVIWILKSTYINGATVIVDGGRTQGIWKW